MEDNIMSSEVERMLLDSDYEDTDFESDSEEIFHREYREFEDVENCVHSNLDVISAHPGPGGDFDSINRPSCSGAVSVNTVCATDENEINRVGLSVSDENEDFIQVMEIDQEIQETSDVPSIQPENQCDKSKSRPIRSQANKSKKKKFEDRDWPWLDLDNSPNNIEFTGTPGVNPRVLRSVGPNPTEQDCFNAFIGNEFWDMLVQETNDYANTQMDNERRKSLKSDEKWRPVNRDEMKAYFSLYVLMGQVKKPTLQMYWSHRKIIETPIFTETMSLERFNAISRFLHFYDEQVENDPNDKLKKIRPVIRYLETKFLKMYNPERDVALDETLLKIRSRLGIIQFNPKKRARFGVKIYKVCESSSGYCSVFKIYVGDDKQGNLPASTSVVLDLMEPYFGQGYVVYLDNWYSSPLLYTALLEKDTFAVGTALSHRQCMPRTFLTTSLEKGEAIRVSGRGVLAVKWKDRKDVHMLSTVHKGVEMETSKVLKIGNTEEEIQKPKAVIEYNKGMLGVDRQDQVLSSFPIMRRSIKAYKKIFFYLMDVTIFNAFCIFRKINKTKPIHFTDFRLNLAQQLLYSVKLPARSTPGRAPNVDSPLRLQAKNWGHFPVQIPPTEKKQFPSRPCKVCKKHKKRSEVRWLCEKCQVPLHLEECFKAYHTKVEY